MKYTRKQDADREAKTRTRLGYPHTVHPVYRHDEGCLFNDGAIIRPYPCTCGNRRRVGWSLVLNRGR